MELYNGCIFGAFDANFPKHFKYYRVIFYIMILNDSLLLQNGTELLTNGSINLTVNVITGKLVTESSVWYQVFSLILSIFSLIFAFYSIYLSQLQGAKIKLVETPKSIELVELKKENYNDIIPSGLEFKKLDLFFTNSGNRAGILIDVHANIHLDEYQKRWLKEPASISIKYGNNSDNIDFLILLDKSVEHAFIETFYLNVIDINKGGPFGKFDSIQKTQDLSEIINKIFDNQRMNLKSFIDFIDENHIFGKMKISYKCTGRKHLLWEAIKNEKLDLEIKGEYIETVKIYRERLKDWDVLPPTKEVVISNLIQFLDWCKPIIKTNLDALMVMQECAGLPNNSYINLLESSLFEYNLLKKWEASERFSKKLYDLIEKMKESPKIYCKVQNNPTLHEEWDQYRTNLMSQCRDVLNHIDDIIDNLNIERAKYNLYENWIFRWS